MFHYKVLWVRAKGKKKPISNTSWETGFSHIPWVQKEHVKADATMRPRDKWDKTWADQRTIWNKTVMRQCSAVGFRPVSNGA